MIQKGFAPQKLDTINISVVGKIVDKNNNMLLIYLGNVYVKRASPNTCSGKLENP